MRNKMTVTIKEITFTMEPTTSSGIDETTSELISRLVVQKDSLLINHSETLTQITEMLNDRSNWSTIEFERFLTSLQSSISDALDDTSNLKDDELVNQLNNIKFKVGQFLAANEKTIGGITEKFLVELLENLKD